MVYVCGGVCSIYLNEWITVLLFIISFFIIFIHFLLYSLLVLGLITCVPCSADRYSYFCIDQGVFLLEDKFSEDRAPVFSTFQIAPGAPLWLTHCWC